MTDQDKRLRATERAIEIITTYLHAQNDGQFGAYVDQDSLVRDSGLGNLPEQARQDALDIRHHLNNLLNAGRPVAE